MRVMMGVQPGDLYCFLHNPADIKKNVDMASPAPFPVAHPPPTLHLLDQLDCFLLREQVTNKRMRQLQEGLCNLKWRSSLRYAGPKLFMAPLVKTNTLTVDLLKVVYQHRMFSPL